MEQSFALFVALAGFEIPPSFGIWVFGSPPPSPAPELSRLRWITPEMFGISGSTSIGQSSKSGKALIAMNGKLTWFHMESRAGKVFRWLWGDRPASICPLSSSSFPKSMLSHCLACCRLGRGQTPYKTLHMNSTQHFRLLKCSQNSRFFTPILAWCPFGEANCWSCVESSPSSFCPQLSREENLTQSIYKLYDFN